MIDLKHIKLALETATPGPWDVTNGMQPRPVEVAGCLLSHFSGGPDAEPHQIANANLIAAAPDMADALVELIGAAESVVAQHDTDPNLPYVASVDILCRVLAKHIKREGQS